MKCPVHLYVTPDGPYDAWTVAYKRDGKRYRQKFSNEDDAQKLYAELIEDFENGRLSQATVEERVLINRLRQLADQCQVPIEVIVSEYTEARRITRVPLTELAQYWNAHHDVIEERTVQQVYEEMIEAKRTSGLSRAYLRDLEQRCGHFVKAFQMPIHVVTGKDIATWLGKLKVSARTKNNFRRNIATMMEFARLNRYLPKQWNEMDAVPVAKEVDEEIEIFTVEEITKLLNRAESHQLPFLAIGAFAGVRHAEIVRLDWSDLNGKYITISAGKAKTASRRLVPIQPNLAAWLTNHRKERGPVTTYKNMSEEMLWLASQSGVKWKHNALRHSYISYRLAVVEDAAKVALECGNSPRMIFRNYRELVTKEQGREWFKLSPNVTKKESP